MRMSLFSSRVMHFLKPKLSLSNLSNRSFLSLFSTVPSPTQASAEHISIIDYLNTNFKFSEVSSVLVSKRLSQARCPQHPLFVLNYFKQIGFSESQIQSMICQQPQILFSSIDKVLKPKIEFIQLLGFKGSELGNLLSKNAKLLMLSFYKTLVPSVEAIRKIVNDEKYFIKLLHRYGNWIIPKHRKVLSNSAFLQSFGIVGSQLSSLLKRQPRLFLAQESLLQDNVSRAVNWGFCINSRMLVHALRPICCMSIVHFNRKLEAIQRCGFSQHEIMEMFRTTPALLSMSEKQLKFKIHVCLDTMMLPKSLLVHYLVILTYSMEDRVIPRRRVLQLLISKNLLKKNPSFLKAMVLREEKFLENYILRFRDNEEALFEAYKGRYLECASA